MGNEGKMVSVHYRGTLDDGTEFDSSYKRNQTLDFTCMAGMMIPGFDKTVRDMEVGETKTVRLEPKEAYGERAPELIQSIPKSKVSHIEDFKVGDEVMLRGAFGTPMPATIKEITEDSVVLDRNPKLAGEYLTFEITLVSAG